MGTDHTTSCDRTFLAKAPGRLLRRSMSLTRCKFRPFGGPMSWFAGSHQKAEVCRLTVVCHRDIDRDVTHLIRRGSSLAVRVACRFTSPACPRGFADLRARSTGAGWLHVRRAYWPSSCTRVYYRCTKRALAKRLPLRIDRVSDQVGRGRPCRARLTHRSLINLAETGNNNPNEIFR